ncbi:MAG: queuosine precursor transporter [Sphingomonadaceae bacterium]|uniref:queuosine precursor transporter n=1 Tax=Thermaurantiacus sp. TaxID=2820283 RepID=UPI00298F0E0A|nr:queuosine precursor transporter [Thermaurantiacus sp.]MCS6986592.1 queuosine precursor transporter [Sphingomonadaceae bacterium]MDW8414147.1 queuosine precursor transporter [Thermaurantiacus sp.]
MDRQLDVAVQEPEGVVAVPASAILGRRLRFYDYCMAAFAVILVCSNLIGAAKVARIELPWIGGLTFGAGILFFPLSYVLGDVLTEVYGYARARRVVWVGFAASAFAAGMAAFIVWIPPAPGWQGQEAMAQVLGQVPRIFAASILAFWAGEIANAFVLARMKVWTKGRWLWTRTIGSTAVGQGVDSLIFYPLAFLGVWAPDLVLTVMATNYLLKVGWEAALTPVTYAIVGAFKRAEGLDVFDVDTDFTPFRTRV